MSIDDRLFAYLRGRLEGHGAIASAGARVVRDDWPDEMRDVGIRVEYNSFRYREGRGLSGQFGLTVWYPRRDAHGPGDNPQTNVKIEALEDAVIDRLAGQRPTGMTGYAVSTIQRDGLRRRTVDLADWVTRRIDYTLSVIPGGTAVPLSGDDADLTAAGIPGRAVGWRASPAVHLGTGSTQPHDAVFRYDASDPSCAVSIDVMPAAAGTPFPAVGSEVSVTFQTQPGTAWTDTLVIQSYGWFVGDAGAQVLRVNAMVANADSAFFGAAVSS